MIPQVGRAKCHLRINHTSAHLPGGAVQQGCKCGGSLRVLLTELRTTAVRVSIPQSSRLTASKLTVMVCSSGGGSGSNFGGLLGAVLPPTVCVTYTHASASGHEKLVSTATWDGSYREPDPAAPLAMRHRNAMHLCFSRDCPGTGYSTGSQSCLRCPACLDTSQDIFGKSEFVL